jgi:predicted enzyme related to lactoylglutathione lyase
VPPEMKTVLYPVEDLEKAKAVFTALLGTDPHVDSKFYIGFSANGAEIGLLPSGRSQGMTGPEPFYDVDDLDATLAALVAAGAAIVQEPTEVGGGMRVAKAKDADGNLIGLRQPPTS